MTGCPTAKKNHHPICTPAFRKLVWLLLFVWATVPVFAQTQPRQDIALDEGWRSMASDSNPTAFDGFEQAAFNDRYWQPVTVPHTWDTYEGYRRMRHGNRHGYAWYRKTFTVPKQPAGKKYFLWFEGVGSYATVWLNGKQVGYHAGGRTGFTIDISNAIRFDQPNWLAVRADHPANIQDLPWVCGGCADERGFSEGSQPMGIFRPVHLIITHAVRIEPFGVHVWNDTTVSTETAQLNYETEIKNYTATATGITLLNRLVDRKGTTIAQATSRQRIAAGAVALIRQQSARILHPHLWSPENPYLYNVVSEVWENGKLVDQTITPYGIRRISWSAGSHQFLLNGHPVFINGVAEYEHLLGSSHAFTAEQIKTRAMQVKAAGFNAFRDAHQPHNLRYQQYWDSLGLLWWPQLSAHIWFDTPQFRENFKNLLKDWVKERRNSPSVILWGLQNESKLPEDFARECSDLIRQLDPTASSQRKITTCNGGSGTDWDVPQNWTGTYGGDPDTYAQDIKRQVLIGEYGAWRTLDLHAEGSFKANGPYSEDRMTQLMEKKIQLAESVKDSAAGHFMWLLTSHDNPGRVQGGEGYRELDRVGPVNYKGLFTPWEEPLDVFYLYRANYTSASQSPMVYIVSHTWPDRWKTAGNKNNIVVYSNCEEVELFNDVNAISLGKRKRNGIGTHFEWNKVDIRYNVLYAVGYVNGKAVAQDNILLHHLPPAPHADALLKKVQNITAPQKGYHYLYRVNCGGPAYTDANGNTWLADRQRTHNTTWGSTSWTHRFPGMPAFFASQRRISDAVSGTRDGKLFQTFRYGREQLQYSFPVQDGEYLVELYFTEPWLGTGGGMDCSGWRLFDVAINGQTVLKNLDISKEAGCRAALKKTVHASVTGGQLVISFPHVASGQAVIAAIAIATAKPGVQPAPAPSPLMEDLQVADKTTAQQWRIEDWLDTGDSCYTGDNICFSALPPALFGAAWIRTPRAVHHSSDSSIAHFTVSEEADVCIALDTAIQSIPAWLKGFEHSSSFIENTVNGGHAFAVYKKRFSKGSTVWLGNNGSPRNAGALMYIVAVTPATTIEPAYDLKPVSSYKAVNAHFKGPGISRGKLGNKEGILFSTASAENVLDWPVNIGAADIYSLTISYSNPNETPVAGKLQLLAADGTLLKEENLTLIHTQPGKLNYLNSTTGTMINAGNYIVRFTAKDAAGIGISGLEVQ